MAKKMHNRFLEVTLKRVTVHIQTCHSSPNKKIAEDFDFGIGITSFPKALSKHLEDLACLLLPLCDQEYFESSKQNLYHRINSQG